MAKPPHTGGEMGAFYPVFKATGITRTIEVHDPPIGGGIVHPQGDGTADAGAGIPQSARAPRCGGAALYSLHRPPLKDPYGAPLHEAQAEDEVIDQYDPIAEGQPVQSTL